jgi:hypothetical protein
MLHNPTLPTQYAAPLQELATFSTLCRQLRPKCDPINMPELPDIALGFCVLQALESAFQIGGGHPRGCANQNNRYGQNREVHT